ncbi:hypothetical protein ACKLNO_04065 [Neisseriaceae bacterium B1]
MSKDWILFTKETKRYFHNSAWIPLKAIQKRENGDIKSIGYKEEFFGCNSVAFFPKFFEQADKLSWNEIIIRNIEPYAYEDGDYKAIDEFQYDDKETIGANDNSKKVAKSLRCCFHTNTFKSLPCPEPHLQMKHGQDCFPF